VLNGQTAGSEPVAGRVVGLAIAPGGQIVYAATACGGVFRSDDGGTSWNSLMDAFDVEPTNFASACLACGAIVIGPSDPNRVFVGTGEGDTNQLFRERIVNALPTYHGVGPIRTDDGGRTWVSERAAAGSPDLAGEAFFGLAIDPTQPDNVIGATTAGLYQRQIAADATPQWVKRDDGVYSAVVVALGPNGLTFFAGKWGDRVTQSKDGNAWKTVGANFPTADVGRIALAVQPNNPGVVYALVAKASNGGLHGVYRFDQTENSWLQVSGIPDVLPLSNGTSQGSYDLSIAVDPVDVNRLYIGGSYAAIDPYPGSIWRLTVQSTSTGFVCSQSASIGTHAHADVHVLVATPADPNELWCGCDGGVFLNRDPTGHGEFAAQNAGLASLCCNFLGQHPTDPNILFTGLQDNGTARTSGGPMWSHVNYGDGGYCLVNWADPSRVLSYANGTVYKASDGGLTHDSWAPVWQFGWATMTQPVVGAPYDPANQTHAEVVAVGAGDIVFISTDFADSWPDSGRITLPSGEAGSVFALVFASATRLFIGTTTGQVYRAEASNNTWTVTRLDNVAAGPLGLAGVIADIEVDWSDSTLSSVYVCFSGMGDRRRVWRFDGTKWDARSGPASGDNLLDVEHNAIVVDKRASHDVYVGADIGVWHSTDQGNSWKPMENGLPDAPVFDLQIHATQRLLRAATYGRGVYEIALD
jgi:photosystem II stability/assembly factor-like uncharacterized protein